MYIKMHGATIKIVIYDVDNILGNLFWSKQGILQESENSLDCCKICAPCLLAAHSVCVFVWISGYKTKWLSFHTLCTHQIWCFVTSLSSQNSGWHSSCNHTTIIPAKFQDALAKFQTVHVRMLVMVVWTLGSLQKVPGRLLWRRHHRLDCNWCGYDEINSDWRLFDCTSYLKASRVKINSKNKFYSLWTCMRLRLPKVCESYVMSSNRFSKHMTKEKWGHSNIITKRNF